MKYRPQLAELAETPPRGPGWLTEIKHDGYRIGILLQKGEVRLESRRNLDWTRKLQPIADAARSLAVSSLVMDGEAVILRENGLSDFQALQNTWRAAGPLTGLCFFGFDLLQLDGEDLTRTPLRERKALLERVLRAPANPVLRYSEHLENEPSAVLEAARKLGAEGVVCKRADGVYHPGRHHSWLKIKCTKSGEFLICGFTEPEGSRQGVGGLLLGRYRNGELVFRGSVGTGHGWTAEFLSELRRGLETLRQSDCPFSNKPPVPRAKWVRPALVCEVSYVEITTDGSLRHPSFRGFRPDKSAREVKE
ncbi:MAG TPA: non-homologous end-joining DNA ligase [Polyangiaceae bacterium]|nr:non-homologous end-joining DNA ligase [Polyangiaceae bacterium]